MTRPAFEMADIVRRKGRQFLQRFKAVLNYQQLKAFRAVKRCRTAATWRGIWTSMRLHHLKRLLYKRNADPGGNTEKWPGGEDSWWWLQINNAIS